MGITFSFLTVILLGPVVGALSHNRVPRGKTYQLQDMYQGNAFFQWNFFTGTDPTNGNVNYLSQSDAQNGGLAYVDQSGAFVLAVDSYSDVPAGGKRNSVRIQSQKQYNGGLFILDARAMPVGCGTWPSFWSNGPNWPLGGEIDIVEGINSQPYNQMTLHSGTQNPCTLDPASSKGTFSGHILGTKCYSTQNADSGCSIADAQSSSFGYGFNGAQGGVYAFLWDAPTGMSMWHFTRANIPSDITKKQPTPSGWGMPSGFWSAATCDISDNFYDHTLILDTTICGGWAGSAYGKSGCPGTCTDMVANATNFADAKWVIEYLAIYQ